MEDETKQPIHPASDAKAASAKLFALRRQRINEYIAAGLTKPDAGEALIQSFNGDLMAFATSIAEGMQKVGRQGPASLEDLEPVLPMGVALTRTTRQIANFTNVLMRLEDRRLDSKAEK